ncbi:MAG: heme-binding protein [Planctomycetaceae bacterium]
MRSVAALAAMLGCLTAACHAAEVDRWEQGVVPMPVEHRAERSAEGPAAGQPSGQTADPTTSRTAGSGGESPPFTVPRGFVVERIFSVPRDELGSWVCLATDPAGRIFASDQGDKGLVRITPAPADGSAATKVERVPVPLSSAQGMLWAFDALYVVCNGGPGSGLYRVDDSDADDMPDRVEKLRVFDGGGEHGPHAVVLSPDGTRLFVLCGNHTTLPFEVVDVTPPQTMGGVRSDQRRVRLPEAAASRLPANWDEDQIIPRMWDANGHAVGILAPGGFVVSTDPHGRAWEVWSAGYRNPYDMAFNADGELFVYDADMEWDFGTPWYRPTRINHATSGSELGWRSGSGKWPAAFPDSLPPLVEIGPGSPVGVTFGYGTRFPARYQRALFACDWTFGTMYAIHVEPSGSTYAGTAEEFVSRAALPLTDAVVGRDGCLYFAVGGRGSGSELFRVRYAGDESTETVDAHDPRSAAEREVRRGLEALHAAGAPRDDAAATALRHLGHPDRFIRYAARVALEHLPLAGWRDAALASPEPLGRITAAIAVARQGEPADQPAVWAALDTIDAAALDDAGRIDLARACELAIVRLGEPPADVKAAIAGRIAPFFPSGCFDLDRELASLLVALRAPGIVPQLVDLLESPTSSADRTNLAPDEDDLRRLVERNADYGSAVRAALEQRSDLIQVHYAYALRTVTEPEHWTDETRRAYLAWFRRTRDWAGGNSFQKFLTAIETESLAGLSDTERLALEANGIRTPYVPPPLPRPEGPGRIWSTSDVLAAAEEGLAAGTRDFDHGRRTFAAARCIVCHRFGGDGGSTGPDLTQAGGRFQVRDVVEALVEPSRVVSDQYRATVVQTDDGRVITGRVIADTAERVVLVTDPEDATKTVTVDRSTIESISQSPTSLMPAGLLDQLNEDEVLDLVAYVLSRGSKKDPRFRRPPKRP